MSQKIKQANIFGRLGTGIGQGIAEQAPKEAERYRMQQGLQQLEKESANLSPTQQYTRALGVPGLIDRPQALQSYADLLRQSGMRGAFKQNAPRTITNKKTEMFLNHLEKPAHYQK